MSNDELANDPKTTGVPAPSGDDPKVTGVPSPQEGMARQDQPADVEKLRAELESAQQKVSKYEKDMDRLRSSYDQRYSQDLSKAKTEAQKAKEAMQQAIMANLDDADRLAYERDIERERRLELEQELQAKDQSVAAIQSMNNYAQAFMKMGVKYDDLDFSSPDQLYASGWQGVMKVQDGLRNRIEELEARGATPEAAQAQAQAEQSPRSSANVTAPPIMAQHGDAPSGEKTIQDVIKALSAQYPNVQWNEDMIMTYIGRNQLPANILDGVNWDRSILGG
jgi:hypothetical protein